jgi:Ni,Fe-hydrogenase maturation factor
VSATTKTAIIVGATQNGDPPGTVSLLDLSGMNELEGQIDLRSCHAVSLPHELRLAKATLGLPRRIIFVGIEVANSGDQLKLNPELQPTATSRQQFVPACNHSCGSCKTISMIDSGK